MAESCPSGSFTTRRSRPEKSVSPPYAFAMPAASISFFGFLSDAWK